MKRYGVRAAILAAVVLAVGALLLLRERPAAAETPQEAETQEAQEALLQIRSETGRETVSLYTEDWKPLDRLRLSEAGEGSLPWPGAGTYRLIRGDGSTLTFTLSEDGTAAVTGGKGWGDGPILALTDEARGSILVRCHGDQMTCRLEGGGTTRQAALETVEEGAECCFSGLLPGEYQLFVGDEWVVAVTVKEPAMDRVVELY